MDAFYSCRLTKVVQLMFLLYAGHIVLTTSPPVGLPWCQRKNVSDKKRAGHWEMKCKRGGALENEEIKVIN